MPLSIVYATEPFPLSVKKTVFLAGPTPRGGEPQSWRPEMLRILSELGFDGHVFVPEPRDSHWASDTDQIGWEEEALNRADCILFWVPRSINGGMPALTTNDEWGVWKSSGKVVWGAPWEAEKVRYQQHYAKKFGAPICQTMQETALTAIEMIGEGVKREGGECQIPLHVWRKPEVQGWLRAQKNAGNRLDGARVVWDFRVPAPDFNTSGKSPKRSFMCAMHVNVYIASEDRHKSNEIVVFRPDTASVVLFYRPPGANLASTRVVLVREFRSPVRNSKSFVYELPGGSSKTVEPMEDVAIHEVAEEVGLTLAPRRLRLVGTRQIGATLAAHTGALFVAKLTLEEITSLEAEEASGTTHGVAEDTELTTTVVRTVTQINHDNLVDWSQYGMIMAALMTGADGTTV